MNLLLDTHALLWWLDDSPELSDRARGAVADPDNTVFLSAVVVWEIRIKEALGKLGLPGGFREALAAQAFTPLAITVDHVHALADLPLLHRDPFDRMLVAQAKVEGFAIVPRDSVIPRYDVPVLAT